MEGVQRRRVWKASGRVVGQGKGSRVLLKGGHRRRGQGWDCREGESWMGVRGDMHGYGV